MASELGDPDAQQELAFCLSNGKGCKKDRKEAAKWYRAAVRLTTTLQNTMFILYRSRKVLATLV